MTEVDGGLDEPEELQPEQGALALMNAETDTWSRTDWEAETARVLRKTRKLTDEDPDDLVWDKLTRTTLDAIAVTPLGVPGDVASVPLAAQRSPRIGAWDIRAPLDTVGISGKTANEIALVDLEGGVTSLWLQADASADLDAVLAGIYLDLAPVVLSAPSEPGAALALARVYLAHLEATEPADGTNLGISAAADAGEIVEVAALARDAGVRAVVVDATSVHDRGASDAQDLAYALTLGVRALRVLTDAGIDAAEAARLMEFRIAITDEQFPGIAKLRAARRIWARVLELSGADAESAPQRQHAVTSRPMMSRYDPYVNMLRTTVAAFAAGVGGADSVTVLPFDSPLGRPETLGRRVARNISHLLIDEAHLGKVGDIAGGAYAVERLTDDLAHAAWAIFTEHDSGATDVAAIEAAFAPLIEASVAEREQQIATRRRPLTGLSEFPNLAEELPVREPDGRWEQVRPYGTSYEALRDAPTERPVFLATLGPVATHTARATFASNLFAAGGVGVEVAGATDGVEAVVSAYEQAGRLPVACLAGADKTYAEWGEQAAAALREAGATHVIIAGKPVEYADDACGVGIDALAFLQRTREKVA